jgi:hypothetical protein
LNRPPKAITLLAVVEACQGAILADFCRETRTLDGVCAFHLAAVELHQGTIQVLGRWSVDQFIEKPGPCGRDRASIPCLLQRHVPEAPVVSHGRTPRRQRKAQGAAARTR